MLQVSLTLSWGFFVCLFFLNPALKDFELPQIFKERGVGRQSPSKKKVWNKPRESKQQPQPSVFMICVLGSLLDSWRCSLLIFNS